MSISSLVNKYSPTPNATAEKICRLSRGNGSFDRVIVHIISCCEKAKRWEDLSPTERIMLELKWTDLMQELLGIGNVRVMHSLHYRLREQTPEEAEQKMQLEEIIMDYDLELEALYKVKINADPIMFDSDKLSHGYTCSCCSRSLDAVNKRQR